MTTASSAPSRMAWHEWFKFTVYVLLAINVALFFDDEWDAAAHLFGASVPLTELITAFAASIDTFAWVILLILFELETYQIPDDRLKPPLTTAMHTVRVICYGFIVYAFYGYLTKMLAMYGYVAETGVDVCALEGYSVLLELDEYEPLTAANCTAVADASPAEGLVRHLQGAAIVASPGIWLDAVRLTWVDVINSATWLVVVAVLELDVRLQTRGALEGLWLVFSRYAKYVLYTVLFAAALYWGVEGSFLDFWDAFLWLVAFIFIELNVFEWREELQESQP